MTNLLIYADTERSATMRHEVPLSILDPFLYLERDGQRIVFTNLLERDRLARVLPDAQLVLAEDLGMEELLAQGLGSDEVRLQLIERAVERAGIERAAVPGDLPVLVADRLRAAGVVLDVDPGLFEGRRRIKNEVELQGIRRAQRAADAAMRAAADLLASATIVGDGLHVDDEPLTAERVREVLRSTTASLGAPSPPDIMVTSAWSGGGHDPGAGPLPANLPIEIDLWPRDEATGCSADMTRTFVVGDVPEEVAAAERVVRGALEAARAATKPGVTGRALYDVACDVIEAAGYPTRRSCDPDEVLSTGFYFSLGHGIGLEAHERPWLGRSAHDDVLVEGDVIALEPGIEGMPWGGVRLEDLLLVTDDGCETLTDFPCELAP